MKEHIVWKDRSWGTGRDGLAGERGFALVSVYWSSQRTGPKWVVKTQLPIVIPADLEGHDDREEAQRMAEELITRFLKTIGARWV